MMPPKAPFEFVESPSVVGLGPATRGCPCPWCFAPTPSGYGGFHGACLDAYVAHPTMAKWRARYRRGFDLCGLCGGNARTCSC